MKILVLGQDGHGKTTFANMLAAAAKLAVKDSSWFALERAVWPAMSHLYNSMEECFEDRVNNRSIWKALIAYYNSPDKARLCKELLEEADMYVGMRCPLEYEASKNLFDVILYCDASKRTGVSTGSLTIPFDTQRMIKVNTNGTKEDLKTKVDYVTKILEPHISK